MRFVLVTLREDQTRKFELTSDILDFDRIERSKKFRFDSVLGLLETSKWCVLC